MNNRTRMRSIICSYRNSFQSHQWQHTLSPYELA